MKVCAIVLAAGRSRRMGTQKLLLPYGGTTVIGRVVGQVAQSAVDETFVVVGQDGPKIQKALEAPYEGPAHHHHPVRSVHPVHTVHNPTPDSPMLESVRCGLRALPDGCGAVLIALGDQPSITTALVDEMLAAFETCGRPILVPSHSGRRGHPLLFAARLRSEIIERHDDVGLRGLLRAHPNDIHEMDVPSEAILADLDTPEDYRQALAAFGE